MSVTADDTWIPEPDDPDEWATNVTPLRRARTDAPPHDLDAERHLAAAIATGAIPPGNVPADIWYSPRHAAIHDAATTIETDGGTVAIETIAAHLAATRTADIEPGWWLDLAQAAVTPAKAATLTAQLEQLHLARTLAQLGHDLTETAHTTPLHAARILGDTITRLGALEPADPTGFRVADIAADLDDWITLLDRRTQGDTGGTPTGWADLDAIIGGLHPGQLVIAAARPATGKTAWALNLAANITATGTPVAFASIEMSRLELQDRLVSIRSRVDARRIRDGSIGARDWDRITNAIPNLASMPLTIIDDAAATLGSIRADATRAGVGDGEGVIIIDYLQLITHTGGRDATRQEVVAEIARGCKRLARNLSVPVVALAQMSRDLKHRADKRPVLTDLRESGQLEQDADVVIGLHREEMYDTDTPDRGVMEAIVLKQRNGPQASARLAWLDRYQLVANMREAGL